MVMPNSHRIQKIAFILQEVETVRIPEDMKTDKEIQITRLSIPRFFRMGSNRNKII